MLLSSSVIVALDYESTNGGLPCLDVDDILAITNIWGDQIPTDGFLGLDFFPSKQVPSHGIGGALQRELWAFGPSVCIWRGRSIWVNGEVDKVSGKLGWN